MKKIYTLITATLFSFSLNAQAPTFAWAKQLGGTSNEYGQAVTTDASDNVYITGLFFNTIDCDPSVGVFNLTTMGNQDIYITKLDPSGNFIWAKGIGGAQGDQPTSIVVDASGNCYVTGFFTNTVDFDPGVGVFNLTSFSTGPSDVFVVKLNTSGNFVWAKSWGAFQSDIGQDIAVDATGNVYVTGRFQLTVDFDPNVGTLNIASFGSTEDAFISKLDPSGNLVWAKQLGGSDPSGDRGASISIDGGGNVYSTGYFYGTADFDPGVGTFNLVSSGNQDVYVSKLTSAGNFVWAKKLAGVTNEYPNAIETDALGNAYTTGVFDNTADFDPGVGTFNLTSNGVNDIFVSKLDVSGNFVWAKAFGGTGNDEGTSISVDASGNVFTTGWFRVTTDFDPGVGTFNLTALATADIFISKLNSVGNFVWAGQIGSTGAQSIGQGITVDASNNLYLTGFFTGISDFDAGVGTFNMTPFGNADAYVTKYCQAPTQPGTISGAVTVCNGATNTYSITAVPGATSYTWVLPGGWSGTSTTNSINATASATSGNITVTANNACGNSTAQTLAVTVNNVGVTTGFTAVLCNGGNTGTTTATATGTGPFTYLWSNAQTTQTATGLIANTYTVTVTGAGGCTAQTTVIVTQPTVISASATATTPTFCIGGCTNLNINASGGTPGYTYLWMPGSLTTATPNVCPTATTIYTCTVTDANACTQNATTTVTVNALPTVSMNAASTNTCVQWTTDLLTGTPSGGVFSGTAVTGNNFNPSVAGVGSYTITYTYTDVNGCTNTANTIITVGLCTNVSSSEVENSLVIYPNPFSSSITVSVVSSSGVENSALAIYNILGEVVFETDASHSLSMTIDMSELASGIYFIKVTSDEGVIMKKVIKE